MTIKDFKVGQTAYMLSEKQSKGESKATEVEVVKVGRKYVTVTVNGNWWNEIRFFEPHTEAFFLYEDKDYGVKRLLFQTAKDVDDYNELIDLRSWVQEATNWMKVKDYTLAQLRAVKKILEEEPDHG